MGKIVAAVVVLGVYLALLGAGLLLDSLWPVVGWALVGTGVLLCGWGLARRNTDAP